MCALVLQQVGLQFSRCLAVSKALELLRIKSRASKYDSGRIGYTYPLGLTAGDQ